MSEDDNWEKRMRKFLPSPWGFDDIEKMIEEMEKMFEKEFDELEKMFPDTMIRERLLPDGRKAREIGPIVYGYSITIGPDGKPVIREFGNVKRTKDTNKVLDTREPLVDIVTNEKEVRIIVEIPGVNKEDINLSLEKNKLIVSVETESRKYYKEIDIPYEVDYEKATSRYNNGILEVILPLSSSSSRPFKIRVE